jgi:glutamine amidotransferase-like uncharacterized protein
MEQFNRTVFVLLSLSTILLSPGCEKSEEDLPSLHYDSVFVALYIDDAVWPNCKFYTELLLKRSGFSYGIINRDTIIQDKLERYSVLLMPGGRPDLYADNLGHEGLQRIRSYVNRGGGFIGICGGANLAVRHNIWRGWAGEPRVELAYDNELDLLDAMADGPVEDFAPDYCEVKCRIKITDKLHPIAQGLPDTISYLYDHGPMFYNMHDESCRILGTSVNGNRNFIVCNEYGNGKVFLTSGHPEIDDSGLCLSMMRHALVWCTNQKASATLAGK